MSADEVRPSHSRSVSPSSVGGTPERDRSPQILGRSTTPEPRKKIIRLSRSRSRSRSRREEGEVEVKDRDGVASIDRKKQDKSPPPPPRVSRSRSRSRFHHHHPRNKSLSPPRLTRSAPPKKQSLLDQKSDRMSVVIPSTDRPRSPRATQTTSRFRNRSRSPPQHQKFQTNDQSHAFKTFEQRGNALVPVHPMSAHRPHGSLIILMLDESVTPREFERQWKPILHDGQYNMYDYLYPFRIAARTILRQNDQYRQKSSFSNVSSESLALHLAKETSAFMGENFIYDYFYDWMINLKPAHSTGNRPMSNEPPRIVICGLSFGAGSQTAIRRLRQIGGIVVSGTSHVHGEVQIQRPQDLGNFIRSVSLSSSSSSSSNSAHY